MAENDKNIENNPIPPFANTPLSSNSEYSGMDGDEPVISLENDIPAVADSTKKSMAVLGVAVVGVLFIAYNLFIKEDPIEAQKNIPKPLTKVETAGRVANPVSAPAVAPTDATPAGATSLEVSAPSPTVSAPPPPPPPPPPTPQIAPSTPTASRNNTSFRPATPGGGSSPSAPQLGGLGVPSPRAGLPADVEAKRQQRTAAPMLVGGGGGSAIGPSRAELADGDFRPEDTKFQNVKVTKVGDPYTTILQGKMLDAVLETAINSDLPGVLRAIVSRDVYAEKGKTILVPKGSRLVGTYESEVKRGQARIYIIWNRIIRPDGIDIAVESPATDVLGRSGVEGVVDNKYLEIFSNSLLLSTVTIGFAAATEGLGLAEEGVSQGETGSGNTTTSGSVTDIATNQAVGDFSSTAKSVVGELVNVKPTVTVDQGTKIKVFVNRDVRFPKDIASGLQLVN